MTTTSLSDKAARHDRAHASRREPSRFLQRQVEDYRRLLLLMAAHVPLAFFMRGSPLLATVHALATLAFGLHTAVRGTRASTTAVVASYIVGVELLWRGSGASVFWELGKYASSGLLILSMLRFGAFDRRSLKGVFYAALMLPSLLVLPYFDRQEVAFNISGPVALGIAIMYFSVCRIRQEDLFRILLGGLIPIVGMGALAMFSTYTADPRLFYAGTKATSAGIGPNQMASVLGLGMLLAFLLHFIAPKRLASTNIFIGLAVLMGIQSLMTFSRGGIWGSLGALLVASAFLVRTPRSRRALLGAAILALPLLQFVALPLIDNFTGGYAVDRFQQTDLTGRDKIMEADWIAFKENPFLGVGPGQSKYWHDLTFRVSSSHTEYTRLLAEHGTFGLLAILQLLAMAGARFFGRGTHLEKAVTLSLMAWTLLYLGHSAMRLAAPSFVFGLAAATFVLTTERSMLHKRRGALLRSPRRQPLTSG